MKRLLIPATMLIVVTLACGVQAPPPTDISPVSESPTAAIPTVIPFTVGPSPTPTATPYPSDPCVNPLYPLVKGSRWIYQVSNKESAEPSKVGITVEMVEENKATVNALNMATGVITQTIAECDGTAIKNFPSMTMSLILSGYLDGEINLEYVSGLFSPSNQDFLAKAWALTWEGDYIARGDIEVEDEEDQVTVIIRDSPVHLSWNSGEAGAPVYETLTVPAGTFDNALKVTREMDLDVTLVTDLGSFNGTLKINSIHWFQPSTGLLKEKIESGDLTYMGMTFPITLSGQVELVEFKP
jgi:hypothetical protein